MTVTLRDFQQSDADLLVSSMNNKTVTRYITDAIPQPYTLNDANWWINTGSHSDLIKAIEFNGEFVGCISAKKGEFEYKRSAELGYWLGSAFWNQGIATDAVTLFTNQLFDSTDLIRLFVSVVAENAASIRVLEKNGYTHEGLLKKASFKNGEFFDECILAKTKI